MPPDRDLDSVDAALTERAIRAAWMYYERGLNQDEISHRLLVSRSTVSRLLAHARESGIVEISLTLPLPEVAELEERLYDRFPLDMVIVEPVEAGGLPRDAAVRAGARFLARLASNTRTIGIGWGATLAESARSVRPSPARWLKLVDVVGKPPGTTDIVVVSPILAQAWSAELITVPAPAFPPSAELHKQLLADSVVRDVLNRGRSAGTIVVSVGDLGADATFLRQGVLSKGDIGRLRKAGAVGDILGHFYDSEGQEVSLEGSVGPIGLGLGDLRSHSSVVAIASGTSKLAPLRAAAAHGLISGLVTDEVTARELAAPS